MKKSKILYGIAFIIIIIGIIMTATLKFNFGLEYEASQRLEIYIGKVVDQNEVKQIAKEVFKNEPVLVQTIEVFSDMVAITVKQASEEQINGLVDKINEKYELELKKEDITITNMPHVRGRDLVKQYILPLAIATAIILIYLAIRYYKIGGLKVIGNTLVMEILIQAVYLSLIAITRLNINAYTIPVGITIGIVTLLFLVNQYEKKLSEKLKEENKED